MVVQQTDQAVVLLDAILGLARAADRFGVDRFEADEEAAAPRGRHACHEIRMVDQVGGGRAVPSQFQWLHRVEQAADPAEIADQVVVDEHHLAGSEGFDLVDDVLDGAGAVAVVHVVATVVAEFAAEGAAPAGDDDVVVQVRIAGDELPYRLGNQGQVGGLLRPIDATHGAVARVGDDAWPLRFGFADAHRVAVGKHGVGIGAGVDPAEHHLAPCLTEFGGDPEGPVRGVDIDRDAHEVGEGRSGVDGAEVFVGDSHLVRSRCQRRQYRQAQRWRHASLELGIHGPKAHAGLDQEDA